jgi:hypothetical protein
MKKQSKFTESFNKGFKKNSFSLIIIGLGLAFSIMFLINSAILNGGLLKVPVGYLQSVQHDFESYVSYQVYQEKISKTENHRVYFIGGSSMREALPDQAYMDRKLKENYGQNYEAIILSTRGMSMSDILIFVDNLPRNNSTLVLGTAVRKTSGYTSKHRFFLTSESHKEYFKDSDKPYYGFVAGLPIVKAMERLFYSTNVGAITEEFVPVPHHFPEGDVVDRDVLVEAMKSAYSIKKVDDSAFNAYRNLMASISKRAKEQGFNVVLTELPYNVGLLSDELYDDDSAFMIYNRVVKEISQGNDITYLDFVWDLDLEYAFRDGAHLSNIEGRGTYADALIGGLNDVLR